MDFENRACPSRATDMLRHDLVAFPSHSRAQTQMELLMHAPHKVVEKLHSPSTLSSLTPAGKRLRHDGNFLYVYCITFDTVHRLQDLQADCKFCVVRNSIRPHRS